MWHCGKPVAASTQQRHAAIQDVVVRGDDLQLAFVHQAGDDSGRFAQSGRLDTGIRSSDGVGVWASLIDGWLDVRKESADLSGNCRAFYGRPHGTAIGVSNHQDYFRAQDRRAILEAGDNLRGDDIACHAGNKNTSDRLIKNQLYRHTRIGA
jgi:hypothetical protein